MNVIEPRTRRRVVRGILIVVYAGLMSVAFMLGKGHTLLLDNKDSADGSVKALEAMTISINGEEPMEFMSGDRDMVKVRAQWHTIKIDINGRIVEKKITIPLGVDMALLSIPKLVAGLEPALIPFIAANEPAPPADPNVGNSNEFTSPESAPAVPLPSSP